MTESEVAISEELHFVYRKELWFANVFINSTRADIHTILRELEEFLKGKLKNLERKDLPNCAWSSEVQNSVMDISKHISFKISWNPVLMDFPFQEDKLIYNQAGYFEFDVEYFKQNIDGKRKLKPWILHEVPVFVLNQLEIFFSQHDYISIDRDPMYIVAIADRTEERGLRVEVPWTNQELERHKKCISQWISLYSGRWDDFRESYLENTIKGNLAYRKSELHYIRDESAFFYISESDFNTYFEPYYKKRIIKTIADVRAFQNAIISVNRSIDELKTNINTVAYFKLESVSLQLSKLEYLVGIVDGKISSIKNELESNRFRYYKDVLHHLVEIMDIDSLSNQLHKKISQISESLRNRYQKIQQASQEHVEKSTYYLNIFFGLGLLADIVTLIATFLGALYGDTTSGENIILLICSGFIGLVCLILVFIFGIRLLRLQRTKGRKKPMQTVDAVVVDEKDRLILIKRKFEPFKDAYALPGGFIELAENPDEALVRETRNETGVDLQFGEMKFIRLFDEKGRDPRGPVHSRAYLCMVHDIEERTKDFTDKERLIITAIVDLKHIELAFDHKNIIKDALKLRETLRKR